jgi:ribosomal protein S30
VSGSIVWTTCLASNQMAAKRWCSREERGRYVCMYCVCMYCTKGGTRRPQDPDVQHRLIKKSCRREKSIRSYYRRLQACTRSKSNEQGKQLTAHKNTEDRPGFAHVLQTLAIHARLRVEHFMLVFVAAIRPDPGAAYKVSPRILNPA